jgi:hypothetical protein
MQHARLSSILNLINSKIDFTYNFHQKICKTKKSILDELNIKSYISLARLYGRRMPKSLLNSRFYRVTN